MKDPFVIGACAAAVGLLGVAGCAAPPPSPPATNPVPTVAEGKPAPRTAPPAGFDEVRWSDATTPDSPAWKLLQKVVEAAGGAAIVDGVRALQSTGKIQQRSPLGGFEATLTTTYLYPDRVRRDVVLPSGVSVSTIFTPGRAWISSPLGTFDLPEEEREKMKASLTRHPLALLKSRHDRLFRVSAAVSTGPGGERRDVLRIQAAGQTAKAVLDGEHRMAEVSWEGPGLSAEGGKERIRILYSDFRTIEGLVYPFRSEVFSGEEGISSFGADSLKVNEPVPPGLFEPPPPSPVPVPTGTPAARSD